MNRSILVEECVQKKLSGESFKDIRKYLETLELNENDIKGIIKKVDDIVINYDCNSTHKNAKRDLLIGYVLMGIGGLLILSVYLNLIEFTNNSKFLVFIPVLIGYIITIRARKQKKHA